MQPLLVLLSVAGLTHGVPNRAVTCEECRTATQDYVTHLLTGEGITEQTEVMKSEVCPQVTLVLSITQRGEDSS